MAAPKGTIEFIPQEDWEKTTFGKILKWVLTIGRWIVVITELVVVLAFLSRFKFDRELTDLNEQIKQQQSIINASVKFEKEFRLLQGRISTIEKMKESRIVPDDILTELGRLTPLEVSFDGLTMSGNKISLTAVSLSETGLATLINNLMTSPKFTRISISKLSFGTKRGVGITFELTGNLKTARN